MFLTRSIAHRRQSAVLVVFLLIGTLVLSGVASARQATPAAEAGPALIWQAPAPDGFAPASRYGDGRAPVIAGDVVIWPTDRLRAHDLATGEVRWEAEPELQPVPATLPVAGELIVFGVPGRVEAPTPDPEAPEYWAYSVAGVDAASGAVVWATAVDAQIGAPVAADGLVFVVVGGTTLLALDDATGSRRWQQPLPGYGPVAAENGVVVVTTSDTSLGTSSTLAYRATDGEPIWQEEREPVESGTPIPGGAVAYPPTGPAVGAGLVAYGRSYPSPDDIRQEIVALDAETGVPRWTAMTDAYVYDPPTIAGDTVFVQGGDGVRALDAATGDERWRFTTPDGQAITTPVAVADGVVYAGGPSEQFYALDAADGTLLWRATTGDGVTGRAAAADGIVILPVGGGGLRAIDTATAGMATPGPGADPENAPLIDVTGLPPCDVTPRPALERSDSPFATVDPPADGTPAATLVEAEPDEYDMLDVPVIDPADLPTGEPAAAGTMEAIRETATLLAACLRPSTDRESLYDIADIFQDEDRFAALLSDDFLRRDWVAASLARIGYEGVALNVPAPRIGDDGHVLPDGRVGVLSVGTGFYGGNGFYVFVEQDGRWLLDEWLQVAGSGPGL